jgi:hypothetical protein
MSYDNRLDWKNWIEEAISKGLVKFYEHNSFSNVIEIDSGGLSDKLEK